MKKFLSLVLALVMTMSLVTVSAGAKDFTDDDKITYDEAVAVISEIGVVDGYADGKFNPTNTLTRQAAAKIICNLVLGPTTASALAADAAPYKDVPATSEFAGYIAYCQQQGIISGYPDGTFKPGNTLNGYAFMKMLLGALGYDSDVEKFTGDNWTINVAKLAKGIGLDDNLKDSFVGSKAVTREEACLYALNTIQATMVQYDSTASIVIGDASIQISSKAENVPQDGYKDIYESDKVVANRTLQFGEKYFPKLILEKGPNALGRKSDTWTYKNKEVGVYPTEDATLVYTSDMSSTSGKSEVKKALKGYDLDEAIVYHNGQPINVTTTDKGDDKVKGPSATDIAEFTGNGILVEVYADGTDVESVVIIDSYIGQVSKVNKTDESITIEFKGEDLGTITTETGYGVFEKDDYVMVSPVYNKNLKISKDSSDMDDAIVVAAEKVSGKVSNATDSKVVLDGESYKVAEINAYTQPDTKDEVDVYLDAYGYAVYTSNVAAKDFIYVVATYEKTGSWDKDDDAETWVQGVKTDGTEVNYKLHSDSTVKADDIKENKLYSYSISGSKIKLKEAEVATNSAEHYVTYVEDQEITTKTNKLGSYRYFTDETVFISVSGKKGDLEITMGTGKQLVDDATADYAIIATAEKKANKNADIAVVFVNATITADSVSDLVLGTDDESNGYKDLNDTEYDTYEVYIDGEKMDIPVDGDTTPEEGVFYTYSKNSDGAYKLVERKSNVLVNKTVDSVYGKWLDLNSYKNALDTTDAQFVDLSGNDIDDASSLKDLVGVGGAVVTVSVVYNSDDEASFVYVISAKIGFSADDDTYTVDEAIGEDFSSISYKENGVTKTTKDTSFTADEFKSVKVSTIDGFTLKGDTKLTTEQEAAAEEAAANEKAVEESKAAVEAIATLDDVTAEEAAKTSLETAVKAAVKSGVKYEVGEVVYTAATEEAAGSVTATVTLTKGAAKETASVTVTIPAVTPAEP